MPVGPFEDIDAAEARQDATPEIITAEPDVAAAAAGADDDAGHILSNKMLRYNITQMSEFRKGDNDMIALLLGSEGCTPAGSKVMMFDGTMKNIEDVKKGDCVISPQRRGSMVFAKVIALFRWQCNEMYDVVASAGKMSGKKLYSCSYNHKIPVGKTNITANKLIGKMFKTMMVTNKGIKEISAKVVASKPCMVYGFTIASPSHWYITDNMCVTSNCGKSTIALQIAKFIDPNFPVENIVFNADEFLYAVQRAKMYEVIVFDEAVHGLYSKDALGGTTIEIEKLLTTIRWKRLMVIMCIPDIFMISPYIRGRRARCMIRAVFMKDKKGDLHKGYFKFYSSQRIRGIKRDTQTRRTIWPRPNFVGRFRPFPEGDKFWAEYLEKKKDKSSSQKTGKKMLKELKKHEEFMASSYSKKDIARMNGVAECTVDKWMKRDKLWPRYAVVRTPTKQVRILEKYYKKGIAKLPKIWEKNHRASMKRLKALAAAGKIRNKKKIDTHPNRVI